MGGVPEATIAALGAASQAKNAFYDPLVTRITVSNNITQIYHELNSDLAKLCSLKADYEEILHRGRMTHLPSLVHATWSQQVTEIEKEIKDIDKKYELKRQKWKIDFVRRSKFSNKMLKRKAKVFNLYQEGAQLRSTMLVQKKCEKVVEIKTTNIANFPTLQKPLEMILDCLAMKKEGVLLHGSVGAGKTTILENLNNHNKVVQMFEIVMFVKVSAEENKKNFTTKEIQETIIRRLKLNVESTLGCDDVAHIIRQELSDKKFLLLLDDVKEVLDLRKIGISLDKETGSKIVLATRSDHVCPPLSIIYVKVERLQPNEATKMFRNILHRSKNMDSPFMTQAIEHCDGLPWAIKMVASSFKQRNTDQELSDGIVKLRQWPVNDDTPMKELCRILDFCWDHLQGVKRECFLYASLHSEDHDIHIDSLLDCWEAEEFDNYERDPRVSRATGRNIITDLKAVCLLEEGIAKDHVKMQKMVRQIARSKLSDKNLVKTNESLQEAPDVLLWREKKWISLVGNQFESVPHVGECSTLSTLFLHKNSSLKTLPTLFFDEMTEIRVLSLYDTAISCLPSSLSKLTLLRVLYLNSCTHLGELLSDEMHELLNLQVLDIRGTKVKVMASNIEKLNRLKRLLVSLNVFGDNRDTDHEVSELCKFISKISSTLEELVIDVKYPKGHCSEMINSVRNIASTSLKNLMTLKFVFEDGTVDVIKVVDRTQISCYYPKENDLTGLVKEMNPSRLIKSFQVFIGCSISSSPQIQNLSKYKNYLKYCGGIGFNQNIKNVLLETDAFVLINHSELKSISKGEASILGRVQGFLIESCENVTEFIDGKVEGPVLDNLLHLYIRKLPKLKSVWISSVNLSKLSRLKTLEIGDCSLVENIIEIGNMSTGILPSLKELLVYDMPKLVKICSNSALQWPALETLKVQNCSNLDELPFDKDNAAKLRKLVLRDLPMLKKICKAESFESPALEKLQIHGCPDLKILPFDVSKLEKLVYIEGENKWWDALQWQDPNTEELLQKLSPKLKLTE